MERMLSIPSGSRLLNAPSSHPLNAFASGVRMAPWKPYSSLSAQASNQESMSRREDDDAARLIGLRGLFL